MGHKFDLHFNGRIYERGIAPPFFFLWCSILLLILLFSSSQKVLYQVVKLRRR